MDIHQQRAECTKSLHNLLLEEVDKECASHDKTYAAPFKKRLERVISQFIEDNKMNELYGGSELSINVKVIRSAKVMGSYTIFVNVGNGLFYVKITHDGITHKTTSNKLEYKSVEATAIPLPSKE